MALAECRRSVVSEKKDIEGVGCSGGRSHEGSNFFLRMFDVPIQCEVLTSFRSNTHLITTLSNVCTFLCLFVNWCVFQEYLTRNLAVVIPRATFDVHSQKSRYEKGLSDIFGAQVSILNVATYNDSVRNA